MAVFGTASSTDRLKAVMLGRMQQGMQHLTKAVTSAMDLLASPAVVSVNAALDGERAAQATDAPDASHPLELAEILNMVLQHVDVDTLLRSAVLVNKAWCRAVHSPELWRGRLAPQLEKQLCVLDEQGMPLSLPHAYLALQGRNLLRNPTFKQNQNTQLLARNAWNKWQRNAWVINNLSSVDGMAWEAPPAGISMYNGARVDSPPAPLPYPLGPGLASRVQQQLHTLLGTPLAPYAAAKDDSEPAGCLATSSQWSEIIQVVDMEGELMRRGFAQQQAAAVLDAGLRLRFSVLVGGRWDSVGQYSIGVLLDEGGEHVPQIQSFVMRPTRHHFYTGRSICTTHDTWERVEHTVDPCPPGFRRAIIILHGRKATGSLMAGPLPRFGGVKFASAELSFV